ncbi:hypothetical protein FACS18949_08750 [Clostridia bacterium]|nr:hypothetical protein FACS18949_08750 [Clostridia bacterium]
MITVSVGGGFVKVSGHSGYAEQGADIVCAAVSSATELLSAVLDELGESCGASADSKNALVTFSNIDTDSPAVIAYRRHIAKISEDYPKYVKLEEV